MMKAKTASNEKATLDTSTLLVGTVAISLVYVCILFSASEVQAQQESPKPVAADQLVRFDRDGIVVLRDGAETLVPLEAASNVNFGKMKPSADSKLRIHLVDDSMLVAKSFTLTDGQIAFLESAASEPRTLRVRNLNHVLFKPLQGELASQWQQVTEPVSQSGDRLVFQREASIDFMEGVVEKVDESVVGFRTSDRSAEAPLDRITGLVFYHASSRNFAGPTAILRTVAGSLLMVEAATIDGDNVTVVTSAGSEIRFNKSELVSFDFESTRSSWLSNLTPTTVEWKPLLANYALLEDLQEINRPRFNESYSREPLTIRDGKGGSSRNVKTFSHGIAIKAGTRLVFALEQPYQKLTGVVAFSPNAASQGVAEIEFLGDGKELYRSVIKANENATIPLDIDITSIKRLTIRVNYHDGRRVGDILHLCDMKVTR